MAVALCGGADTPCAPAQDGNEPALPTSEAVYRVKRSFARVAQAEALTARFYDRLFALRPDVRPLFASSLADQQHKLASTLAVVVGGLDDFEALRGAVSALGRGHVAYGVSEAHYAAVGAALIWSLEAETGSLLPEEREAWIEVYGFLSTVMMRAARSAAPNPTP
ncbi:MAG: hemin receptor [Phenylobacterium sp.]|uniref:globin domain-containing protein n=1 Tax=Phenylobacterium sp. TaxID=1871053 RepID=UPI0012172A0B|nr:globin domain-containing protein [Phenylobacterium sp.]TAJ73901.1 MAG: hemin receptor [Phenylobacterium sp.]